MTPTYLVGLPIAFLIVVVIAAAMAFLQHKMERPATPIDSENAGEVPQTPKAAQPRRPKNSKRRHGR